MIELVQLERSPEGLARELEPPAATVREWVVLAAHVSGQRHDGPTTAEAEKLRGLRRENRRLHDEREIPGNHHRLLRSGIRQQVQRILGFVKMNRAVHRVVTMCRVLGVSSSGY